jgi:Ca2+/Na+ antiporter
MKKWLKDKFRETLNQTFTLLGMFVAWAVLDGSAKTVVGWAIMLCVIVWLLSMKFREQEEKENDKE